MRRLRLPILLAAWLALAGCGPGTGGTGDGEAAVGLAAFNAAAVDLCSAPFARQLACPNPAFVAPAGPPVTGGTSLVHYADLSSGGRVRVEFEAHSIALAAPCQGLAFSGDWGRDPAGSARFYGSIGGATSAQRVAAAATVDAVAGGAGDELLLQLHEANGQRVLGPVKLQRVAAPEGTPPTCP